MYYLGIDWGLNRTGLAIADDELCIATVFGEIKTEDLLSELVKIQTGYKIDKIIFGDLQQESQFNNEEVNGCNVRLQKEKCLNNIKNLGITVEIAEEMLSTKMAQQNLLENKKKKISKQDNAEAAKIILQGWLDFKK